MSVLQSEVSRSGVTARAYAKIATVFDQLPDRFLTKDVCELLGASQNMNLRAAYAVVLERDFKCRRNHKNVWIKP